jgi:hypothetical protein
MGHTLVIALRRPICEGRLLLKSELLRFGRDNDQKLSPTVLVKERADLDEEHSRHIQSEA